MFKFIVGVLVGIALTLAILTCLPVEDLVDEVPAVRVKSVFV